MPSRAQWTALRRLGCIKEVKGASGRHPPETRPSGGVTRVKWAKAGIGSDVPQGVVTSRVFNECSRAYAIFLTEWSAAETLAGMKRTVEDRIKIVPYEP